LVAVGEGVVEAGGDTESPTVPQSLHLSSDGMLSWDASTDNIGVEGYHVHRSAEAYFETNGMTCLGSTAGTTYSVSGSIGDPATNYYFRVLAFDLAQNESGPSETVGEHDFEVEDGS